MKTTGIVHIVGAGPGDPDLITVQGLRRIREADVILHDRLVHPRLIAEARRDAIVIDVGKRPGAEDEQQKEIHRLMIDYARQGKVVCRLKGGDPFVFGRGGEETDALASAGVPFDVTPGVTSVTAAPASAGIPVTHRGCSHSFLVINGSRSVDLESGEWLAARELLRAGGTVVVVMGLGRIAEIAAKLLEDGCSPKTPAAAISRATWPDQESRVGSVSDIAAKSTGLKSPALIVIGSVAALSKEHLGRLAADFADASA